MQIFIFPLHIHETTYANTIHERIMPFGNVCICQCSNLEDTFSIYRSVVWLDPVVNYNSSQSTELDVSLAVFAIGFQVSSFEKSDCIADKS